jgi:hypothetical protein
MAKHSKVHEEGSKTVTLYTLAPISLDKPGTESVGSYWLYRELPTFVVNIPGEALAAYDDIPGQALREVIMPESKHIAQHQAYVNHRTFTEVGLNKALARGEVYRPDEQSSPASTDNTNNTEKEAQVMPAKKPLNKAQKAAQEKLDDLYGKKDPAQEKEYIEKIGKEVSALDAILAQPIVDMAAMVQAGQEAMVEKMAQAIDEREDKALARSLSMQPVGPCVRMPVDIKALAQAIIQELKAAGLVMAQQSILPVAVEPEPVREPDIWDILGDGTGSSTPMVPPAKPKSTLRVFTKPTPADKTVRASSGKTDPAIVKAIQHAWRSGKVTQAELALKYGMDDKKVWYFCNRAKQL